MRKKTRTNTNGHTRNEKEKEDEREATDGTVVYIERKLLKQPERTMD